MFLKIITNPKLFTCPKLISQKIVNIYNLYVVYMLQSYDMQYAVNLPIRGLPFTALFTREFSLMW